MRSKKLVALSASILILATSGCATLGLKKTTTQRQNQKLPAFDPNVSAEVYYEAWVGCEQDLDECVDSYDDLAR